MAIVALCPHCGVSQTIVTGVGVLRTHDRIGLSTGTNYGECPGSGAIIPSQDRPLREIKRDALKKLPQTRMYRYVCRVCGATTTATSVGRVSEHAWPDGDALCRASGFTRAWIPTNPEAGRPLVAASTGEALTPDERKRYRPLIHQILLDQKRARSRKKAERRAQRDQEAEKRLGERKAADREWIRKNRIRVFSGGAPGLGKRR